MEDEEGEAPEPDIWVTCPKFRVYSVSRNNDFQRTLGPLADGDKWIHNQGVEGPYL